MFEEMLYLKCSSLTDANEVGYIARKVPYRPKTLTVRTNHDVH